MWIVVYQDTLQYIVMFLTQEGTVGHASEWFGKYALEIKTCCNYTHFLCVDITRNNLNEDLLKCTIQIKK